MSTNSMEPQENLDKDQQRQHDKFKNPNNTPAGRFAIGNGTPRNLPPERNWDSKSKQYFWYDAIYDQIVFDDGQRTPRSAHNPGTSLIATSLEASPSDYASADRNYTTSPVIPSERSSDEEPKRRRDSAHERSASGVTGSAGDGGPSSSSQRPRGGSSDQANMQAQVQSAIQRLVALGYGPERAQLVARNQIVRQQQIQEAKRRREDHDGDDNKNDDNDSDDDRNV